MIHWQTQDRCTVPCYMAMTPQTPSHRHVKNILCHTVWLHSQRLCGGFLKETCAVQLPAKLATVFKWHLSLNGQLVCEVCIFRLRYLVNIISGINKLDPSIQEKEVMLVSVCDPISSSKQTSEYLWKSGFRVWIHFYTAQAQELGTFLLP